jgi:hypothetical protein
MGSMPPLDAATPRGGVRLHVFMMNWSAFKEQQLMRNRLKSAGGVVLVKVGRPFFGLLRSRVCHGRQELALRAD